MTDMTTPDATSPAERRRLRVRAAILEAAEKVFAEEGEEGLSIRRLAEEIDYSPAAIYKYFGSKEELVDELKELFFARILERVGELRESDAPFRERARTCLTGYVLTALEKPQHYLAAFSSVLERHHEFPDGTNKASAFEFLIEMVREGQSLGLVDEALDRVAAAKMLWCCIHGAASLMAHMPTFPEGEPRPIDMDRHDFLQRHADFILNGLMRS